MKFPIPDKAIDQHTIVLGKTRSGKSSKMRLLVERLLDATRPVCILDPKGDWWGLKSSADGKKAGFAVIIFGGEHADVPINEHSGGAVAELIATGNRPCIVDLGGWMVGARTRFFIDFAATLFKLTRGARWLVIDECHNFAPQGRVLDPDAGKMLHWANRLASEGAGKGLTLISASQRPQKVHKDYVTSHETLIACRVIHPLDRNAVKEWVDGCADPSIGKEVMSALAGLDRSEAYVWSPEINFGPALVKFPLFRTYDSFKPQAHDAPISLKGWATVNLDDVRKRLASAVDEAKANDPKALKTEIAQLRRQLAAASKPGGKSNTKAGDDTAAVRDQEAAFEAGKREGWFFGWPEGWRAGWTQGDKHGASTACNGIAEVLTGIRRADPCEAPTAPKPPRSPGSSSGRTAAFEAANLGSNPSPGTTAPKPATPVQPSGTLDTLTRPQRRVMTSVAFWRSVGTEQPTRAQVGGVAGYSPSSGGFNNLLGQLNSAGLIVIPAAGRVALAPDAPYAPLTAPEARDAVLAILSNPQRKLVLAALDATDDLTRDELGAATDYSPTSGGFNNLIGSLCTLTIFEKPSAGRVQLSDWAREVLEAA